MVRARVSWWVRAFSSARAPQSATRPRRSSEAAVRRRKGSAVTVMQPSRVPWAPSSGAAISRLARVEIVEGGDDTGVAHADRAAEADRQPHQTLVGRDLRALGRGPLRGAQAQQLALEHVALAGVGLQEPARGERDRRIEALRVERLEGARRGVEARERRALVGHPSLQLVLGLGGGHEAHRLVGQLVLERFDAALQRPFRASQRLPVRAQAEPGADQQERRHVVPERAQLGEGQVVETRHDARGDHGRGREAAREAGAEPVATGHHRDEQEGGVRLHREEAGILRPQQHVDDGEHEEPAAQLEQVGVAAAEGVEHPALTAPGRRPGRPSDGRPCRGPPAARRARARPPGSTTSRPGRGSRSTPPRRSPPPRAAR